MLEDIYNYLNLSETIATSGQPGEAQIAEIAQAGYELVVNLALADAEYSLANEKETVESHGMEYIHLPVIWQHPTAENLEAFCDVMDANLGRKIFVHCAANMRVSAFMALYRIRRLGWQPERAFGDMQRIWTPEGWWRDFILEMLPDRGEA
jgi:uncharacterized protein (TIGR01244 family)